MFYFKVFKHLFCFSKCTIIWLVAYYYNILNSCSLLFVTILVTHPHGEIHNANILSNIKRFYVNGLSLNSKSSRTGIPILFWLTVNLQ